MTGRIPAEKALAVAVVALVCAVIGTIVWRVLLYEVAVNASSSSSGRFSSVLTKPDAAAAAAASGRALARRPIPDAPWHPV